MVERSNDNVNKRDMEIILEVNRKAIEIGSANAELNEEIISLLNDSKNSFIDSNKEIAENLSKYNDRIALSLINYNEKIDSVDRKVDKKLDHIIEQNEKLSRDIFTVQVLFITGVLSLIMQVVQIFIKK